MLSTIGSIRDGVPLTYMPPMQRQTADFHAGFPAGDDCRYRGSWRLAQLVAFLAAVMPVRLRLSAFLIDIWN